jgi:hypothetical protein
VAKCNGGMGFRDMHAFNIALLGKQGWRLITSPNSLYAQVLKSRYYPNSEFMEATVPRAASCTWRAVIAGRESLQRGLIKRIGAGHTVSIWQDSWIHGARSLRPMGRLASADCDMVPELIDHDSHQWRIQTLRENFLAPDVDLIMKVPLRIQDGEDWIAWPLEKSGQYTVGSAYRALVETNANQGLARENNTATSSSNQRDVWKLVWKLDVVPKVQVFCWRVLKGTRLFDSLQAACQGRKHLWDMQIYERDSASCFDRMFAC